MYRRPYIAPYHNFSGIARPTIPNSTSSSLLRPLLRPQLSTRTFLSALTNYVTNRKLKELERIANTSPNSTVAQLNFLTSLNAQYPEAVIRRFESPNTGTTFSYCEQSVREYVKALVKLDRFDANKLGPVIDRLSNGSPSSAAALSRLADVGSKGTDKAGKAAMASALSAATGGGGSQSFNTNPTSPVHVAMVDSSGGWKNQMWKTGRTLAVVFIVVTAFGAILDDKGLGGKLGGGGSNEVRMATESDKRFKDVVGCDEAKEELEEIVEYLREPEKFTRLGGKLPKGLLLTGPPGTGKTLLAKAIAGEAGVPFFYASGSSFEEVYVGVGARRVRDLFEAAKKKSPCIIFIDEIDAIGGSRNLKDQSAMKMTLNELLVQMDGFAANNGIIVIGATNFKKSLDQALIRPGRFDKMVPVNLPDVQGRKQILELYSSQTKMDKDVDISVLARGTPGMSGAELYNLVNQAAVKSSIEGLDAISHKALEWAKDKILMGAERKSALITAKTAKCTAYHEAGHALVAIVTDGADPVHKATIMPRGQALGLVAQLPEGDQTSWSLKQMKARLDVCMGGRVAEELIFGEENVTSGASSDLQQATNLARAMVTKYGFSTEIGKVFHAGDAGEQQSSDDTRIKIDAEVKRITDESYARATKTLKDNAKRHHLLAKALMEFETLTGDECRAIVLKGKMPKRKKENMEDGAKGDQSILIRGGSLTGGVKG